MPFGNGTGPFGLGSMSGRGLGYCAGYPHPGYYVYGRKHLFGRRAGFCRWIFPLLGKYTPTKEEEKSLLESEAEFLKRRLEVIEKRVKDIESEKG